MKVCRFIGLLYRLLAVILIGASMGHHEVWAVSQFRSPLFETSINSHVSPFMTKSSLKFSDELGPACECSDWTIRPWSVGYYRMACEALRCTDKCNSTVVCGPCGKINRRTLSDLWFGREQFTVEDTFADHFLDPLEIGSSYNPMLGSMRMEPFPRYVEWGISLGSTISCRINDCWHVGLRTRSFYKSILITQDKFEEEDSRSTADYPPTKDVIGCPTGASFTNRQRCDYAYRLDFMRPIMEYGDGTTPTNIRTNASVTPISAANAATANLYVVKLCSTERNLLPAVQVPGSITGAVRFGKIAAQVKGPLPEDGSGNDGDVFFFDSSVDYASTLAKNPDAQHMLFLVPHYSDNPAVLPTRTHINPAATMPDQTINNNDPVVLLAESGANLAGNVASEKFATLFLADECGVNLRDDECTTGIGDLVVDAFVGHEAECWSVYGLLGASFPTAKELERPEHAYAVTAGNNGHFEVRIGLDGAYQFAWCGIDSHVDVGILYGHAFKATERKSAPFTGARTRNLGQCVNARVSWHYYVFHADMTNMLSSRFGIGTTIGYELFGKSKDDVKLCKLTAIDCFGREKELDKCILERCTNSMTHKIRGEVFHAWNTCRLFVGGSHIFSGRNAMLETQVHCGMTVLF